MIVALLLDYPQGIPPRAIPSAQRRATERNEGEKTEKQTAPKSRPLGAQSARPQHGYLVRAWDGGDIGMPDVFGKAERERKTRGTRYLEKISAFKAVHMLSGRCGVSPLEGVAENHHRRIAARGRPFPKKTAGYTLLQYKPTH